VSEALRNIRVYLSLLVVFLFVRDLVRIFALSKVSTVSVVALVGEAKLLY
jgi:hypothetical protein